MPRTFFLSSVCYLPSSSSSSLASNSHSLRGWLKRMERGLRICGSPKGGTWSRGELPTRDQKPGRATQTYDRRREPPNPGPRAQNPSQYERPLLQYPTLGIRRVSINMYVTVAGVVYFCLAVHHDGVGRVGSGPSRRGFPSLTPEFSQQKKIFSAQITMSTLPKSLIWCL